MFRFILKDSTGRVRGSMDQEQNSPNPWIPQFTRDGSIDDMIYADNSTYSFEIVDVTEEYALEEQKKLAKQEAKLVAKDAKKALQAVKNADTLNKLQKATEDLAKVVHALVKVLDLTDPTEQSLL
jgi:hypothetical protein